MTKIVFPQSLEQFVLTVGQNNFGNNGILLPKLFRHMVRKKFSSDREKLLKFEAEG